jgi:hypothetical protein
MYLEKQQHKAAKTARRAPAWAADWSPAAGTTVH